MKARSLISLAQEQAREDPERILWTYLIKGGPEREELTAGALDQSARALSARLLERHSPGDRVLLLYPPGLDFLRALFGCMYAGLIAVPAYPPGMNARSAGRMAGMVKDSGAVAALLPEDILTSRQKGLQKNSTLPRLHWLATQDSLWQEAADPVSREVQAHEVAYLQYTSGSTSMPKGVMVTYDNLMHNLEYQNNGWKCSEGSGIVSWMPHFHDFGLVFGLLESLYAGVPGIFFSPPAFVQHPMSWLQAMSDFKASHSAAPNFAYDLCVAQASEEDVAQLDLSNWKVAVNGAEPVRWETLKAFSAKFAPCGFKADAFSGGYGLAETTLKVASGRMGEAPVPLALNASALEENRVEIVDQDHSNARILVDNGCAHTDTLVRIVNPQGATPVPEDGIGEIWVSSPSVCAGYWGREEASAETFKACLASTEGPFFARTGDLGFLHNDHLYITGRLKDLIILYGLNYYPQDIELSVEQAHSDLRTHHGAAFSIERDGTEQLIVVYELNRHVKDPDLAEIAAAVRKAVAEEHALEVNELVLVRANTIPMTSSGKIMRHACCAAFQAEKLKVVASSVLHRQQSAGERTHPETPLEEKLCALWCDVLNIRSVGTHQDFFHLGGSSLSAMQMIGNLENTLGIELSVGELLTHRTIHTLAECIEQSDRSASFSCLVPIRAQGTKAPFFCVHPGGGTVMCFSDLATSMEPDRPFYAFQSLGLDGRNKPLSRTEDMAALYIKEMRLIQPHGPYLIGGMCFGGLVAFEMARQLKAKGEETALLAILDTRRPPGFRKFARRKVVFKNWMRSLGHKNQQKFLKKVWLGNEKARKGYKPNPLEGALSLFWSDQSFEQNLTDRVDLWRSLTTGEVSLIRVPGTHLTILTPPHVSELAAQLDRSLNRVS